MMEVTGEMAMLLKEGAWALGNAHLEWCNEKLPCRCEQQSERMEEIAKEIIDVTAEVV